MYNITEHRLIVDSTSVVLPRLATLSASQRSRRQQAATTRPLSQGRSSRHSSRHRPRLAVVRGDIVIVRQETRDLRLLTRLETRDY